MKAYLEIEMPQNCKKCHLYYDEYDNWRCNEHDRCIGLWEYIDVSNPHRPDTCPLLTASQLKAKIESESNYPWDKVENIIDNMSDKELMKVIKKAKRKEADNDKGKG
jgi:hypothetical protein